MLVIPQDLLIEKFDKKIYSLKVAHPATTISSRYQAWYLTFDFLCEYHAVFDFNSNIKYIVKQK